MPSLKIAVIDDQNEDRNFIESVLQEAQHEVTSYNNVVCPLAGLCNQKPDVIVLDQRMPRKSGVELIKEIRAEAAIGSVPIIMLTGVSEENAKLSAFDSGADDYLVKPFSPRELMARIVAIHRRSNGGDGSREKPIQFRTLRLDPSSHVVTVGDQAVHLTLTEYRILLALLQANGKVVSRDHIREGALGAQSVSDRTIDVHMASLRKKIGGYGHNIETVRSVGYRFRFS